MYKISILVPVYNVEKYLRQCLDSLVSQSLKKIEIICVNDGSTDRSGDILHEYATRFSQIKVINKTNSGYGHTMNTALRAATGEYIGIVESDDFVDAEMFKQLYDLAYRTDADIVKSNFWAYRDGRDEFVEIFNDIEYEKKICPRRENISIFYGLQTIWSSIYQRKFLINNDIWFNETPGASYQDVSFVFKSLACARKMVVTKNAFVHYRMDNPSSSVKSKQKVYCIFDEVDNIESFLSDKQELKEHCLCILAALKYRLFKENFSRISLEYKMPFLYRAIEELKNTAAAGYVKEEYWDDVTWNHIQRIIQDSNHYIYEVNCDIQKKMMLYDGFWMSIARYDKVYFYGAGKIAYNLLKKFKEKDVCVEACLVSDKTSNVDNLLDVQVIKYNSDILNKNMVIITAVSEKYQSEILSFLNSDNANIILLNNELRDIVVNM